VGVGPPANRSSIQRWFPAGSGARAPARETSRRIFDDAAAAMGRGPATRRGGPRGHVTVPGDPPTSYARGRSRPVASK